MHELVALDNSQSHDLHRQLAHVLGTLLGVLEVRDSREELETVVGLLLVVAESLGGPGVVSDGR